MKNGLAFTWFIIAAIQVIMAAVHTADSNYGWAVFSGGWAVIAVMMIRIESERHHDA